ncbi:MAG: hypothetical protein OHK0017_04310 [Patescibacteria group bacterium]
MVDSIYTVQNGISIIDLAKTKASMESSLDFIYRLGTMNKQILIVGTTKHVSDLVIENAAKMGQGMPYVAERWLGGTLSNWDTVRKTLKTLARLKALRENEEEIKDLKKREKLSIDRRIQKLDLVFGGLSLLKNNRPAAIIVLDVTKDDLAVREAGNIPVIALVNTSENPKGVKHVIPANNYSRSLVQFFLEKAVESYNQGQASRAEEMLQKEKNSDQVKTA